MKKTFRTVALLATIGLAAVACQKEPPIAQVVTEPTTQRVMHYCVEGIIYEESVNDETALRAFWQSIFALAREGYEVDVFDESKLVNEVSAKEVVTYTTESEEDALIWSKNMVDQGYHVHISFKDGIFTCTAVK